MISQAPSTFSATIQYLERNDLYKVEKPYQTTFDTSALGGPTDNLKFVERTIDIHDAQSIRDRFSIDKNGFEFHHWPTELSLQEFGSDEHVRKTYYPEIERYVTQARSGCAHIHMIAHIKRDGSLRGHEADGINPPVPYAHVDFSPIGGETLLEKVFAERPDLRGRRYEFLNVWRVTKGPNRNWPLAVCDYRSLSLSDDVDFADVIHRDHAGEQMLIYGNPSHKWYFLDNEGVDDVILFRQTDSRGTHIPFSAHVSFENQALADARRSIEVRLVCFY